MSIDEVLWGRRKDEAVRDLMRRMEALQGKYEGADEELRERILMTYKADFTQLAELTYFRRMVQYVRWYRERKNGS